MKPRNIIQQRRSASSSIQIGLSAITFSLLAIGQAAAQDTWDGGGTDNKWSTGANWGDNGAPVPATTGALTFSGVAQVTTDNDLTGVVTGAISFANTGEAGLTGSFVLNGNAITLGGDITATAPTTGNLSATINLGLVLNGNRTIVTNGNGSPTRLHPITINGIISQDGTTARNLAKAGSGTSGSLTLTGNNTYTGVTQINTGSIIVTKIADSGASNLGFGNLRIGNQGSSGELNYQGSGATTSRTLQVGGGNLTTHTGGGTIASNGVNGGSGLRFTAANLITAQADAAATARTLTIGGTNTDANTISGVIGDVRAGTTALNVNKSGASRWILSNTANTYKGVTTIAGGTLWVNKLADGGANSSIGSSTNAAANLVFSGGSLIYTGAGDSTDRLFTYTAPNFSSGFQINSSGSGALSLTNTGALVQTVANNGQARFLQFTGTNQNDNIYAGAIGLTGGTGAANLSKGGSGKWVLTGASSYTGSTFLQTGTLEIRSGDSGLTYSVGGLSTSIGEGTLIANKSAAGSLAINFTSYGRGVGASANIVSTGGTNGTDNNVTFGTGAQGFINNGLFFGGADYAARNAADSYTRALAYGTDPNTVAIDTVTAANHVKLTASHTPTATLTLLSLNLAGNEVNWNSGFNINLATPAIVKAGGGSSAISGAGALSNAGAELVIRTDTAEDALTISTNLNGGGALTKTGKGMLTLNTGTFAPYTGATHVNEGTLSIGINRHLGAEATGAQLNLKGGTLQVTGTFGLFNGDAGTNNRAVVLTNQSGIEVTGSNTLTIAGVVSHLATASTTVMHGFNKLGTGTLVLSGANTYNGATNVNAGTLIVNGSTAASSLVGVATGATLAGSGTIGGKVTLAADSNLAPGSMGVGTLTVGSIDISAQVAGTGKLNFELATIAMSDKVATTGELAIGSGVLGFNDFTFTELSSLQNGTYKLISGASSLIGTLDAANLTGTIGGGSTQGALQITGSDLELVITGGISDPFATWASNASFSADTNNDGVPNGLAWLLGATNPNVNATGLLPQVQQTAGGLKMTFSMLKAADRAGAMLNVEHSSDLGLTDPWSTGVMVPESTGGTAPVTFTVNGSGTLNVVEVTISSTEAAAGKLFGRLNANR